MEGTAATAAQQAEALVSTGKTFTTGLLDMGTSIFNWAMNNPLFLIGILITLFFVAVCVVKSLCHR